MPVIEFAALTGKSLKEALKIKVNADVDTVGSTLDSVLAQLEGKPTINKKGEIKSGRLFKKDWGYNSISKNIYTLNSYDPTLAKNFVHGLIDNGVVDVSNPKEAYQNLEYYVKFTGDTTLG